MKRRLKATTTSVRDRAVPPVELTDPEHRLWHSRGLHVAYMAERGWDVDVRDRFEGIQSAHPESRRGAAVEGWAADDGVTDLRELPEPHRLQDAPEWVISSDE